MIPALIVPVLTRPDLLYRMVASIDDRVEHLVVIDNGDCVQHGTLLKSTDRAERVSLIKMPANLGVAGSWNLGIKAAPFAPWWMVVNFDVVWPAGSLARFAASADVDALTLSGGAPPWCAFIIGENVVRDVGLFDEGIHPAYFEDDDMARRCEAAGRPIVASGVEVWHDNSSTLAAGFSGRNGHTFDANAVYYASKRERGDMSEGRWSLDRRRELTWD